MCTTVGVIERMRDQLRENLVSSFWNEVGEDGERERGRQPQVVGNSIFNTEGVS